MKTRWTTGSIRLRITPEELATLERGEAVGQSLQTVWRAEVVPSAATALETEGATIRVRISRADVEQLAAPENEGVYFRDAEFRYFIEKDFPCVHPRAGEAREAPTSTFSPPSNFAERKSI